MHLLVCAIAFYYRKLEIKILKIFSCAAAAVRNSLKTAKKEENL